MLATMVFGAVRFEVNCPTSKARFVKPRLVSWREVTALGSCDKEVAYRIAFSKGPPGIAARLDL